VEGEKNITKLANHNCPCNSNAAAIAQSYGLVFSKSFLLTNMQEVSLSSPPSRKNALPPLLLRQLIQDIDSNGGIDLISVRNLCNRKVDIYGTPGSHLRRCVQNQVHRWKTTRKDQFQNLQIEFLGGASISHTFGLQENLITPPRKTSSSHLKQGEQALPRSKSSFASSSLTTIIMPTTSKANAFIERVLKTKTFCKFFSGIS
jgi:hypothetical protein